MSVILCGVVWCIEVRYTNARTQIQIHAHLDGNGRTLLSVWRCIECDRFLLNVLLFSWFDSDSNFIYYSNWLDVYTHICSFLAPHFFFFSSYLPPSSPLVHLLWDEIHSPLSEYIYLGLLSFATKGIDMKKKKERKKEVHLLSFSDFSWFVFTSVQFISSEWNEWT